MRFLVCWRLSGPPAHACRTGTTVLRRVPSRDGPFVSTGVRAGRLDLASRVRFERLRRRLEAGELLPDRRRAAASGALRVVRTDFLKPCAHPSLRLPSRPAGHWKVFARGEADGGLLVRQRECARRGCCQSGARSAAPRRDGRWREASVRPAVSPANAWRARRLKPTSEQSRSRGGQRYRRMPRRVFQVMEALQDRDAVSRIARNNAPILGGARRGAAIMSRRSRKEASRRNGPAARCASSTRRLRDISLFGLQLAAVPIRAVPRAQGDSLSQHHAAVVLRAAHGSLRDDGARYAQLSRSWHRFDLVIGDSNYNLAAYAQHTTVSKPMLGVYPIVDRKAIRALPWDADLQARIRRERAMAPSGCSWVDSRRTSVRTR